MTAGTRGDRFALAVVWAAFVLALVAAWTQFEWQRDRLLDAWPIIERLGDPAAQHRLVGGTWHYPHDLLAQADAAMPVTATVLLVTPGSHTTDYEYTTYHRALYMFAPRPVWWLVPTPPDGTWKARWWISAPLDAESVRAVARDKGASYVLAAGVDLALDGARVVSRSAEGSLVRLDGAADAASSGERGPQFVQLLGLLTVALGITIPFVLGAGLVRLAGRWGYRARGVEAWALAWGLGAGAVTALMLPLLAAGAGWVGTTGVLGVGALGIAVYLLARRQSAPDEQGGQRTAPEPPPRLNVLVDGVLMAAIAVQTTYVALMALGRPLIIWDAWVNWATKARSIFYQGAIGPAVYSDPSRALNILDYPLHLPLLEAWVFRWAGAPDDRLVGITQLLFYLALVALVYAAVREMGTGRTLALAAAAVVATTMLTAALAADGFAEAALMVYAFAAATYLVRWLRDGQLGALLIAAISGGLMAWTKREGVVLLGVLCLAAVVAGLARRRAWLGAGALALGGAVLAGPWYAFVAAFGIPSAAYVPISLDAFGQNSDRLPFIWAQVRDILLQPRLGWLWPLAGASGVAALLAGAWRRLDRWSAVVPLFALLYLGVAPVYYVFSAFVPLETHILTSVERLFSPQLPLLAVWIASLGPWGHEMKRNAAE